MDCPNCNSVLIKVERKNIEFEYCPECGGFFLDADEWYVVKCEFDLTSKIDDIMRVNSLTKIEEKAKNCPICNDRMEKINLGGLVLDRCVRQHGVWFDKGELSDFINKNAEQKNETIKFLGETFIR